MGLGLIAERIGTNGEHVARFLDVVEKRLVPLVPHVLVVRGMRGEFVDETSIAKPLNESDDLQRAQRIAIRRPKITLISVVAVGVL